MLTKLKQYLCKHKWIEFEQMDEVVDFEDMAAVISHFHKFKYRQCNKCGKLERI